MRLIPQYALSKEDTQKGYSFTKNFPKGSDDPKYSQILSGLEGKTKEANYFFLSPVFDLNQNLI